jgi:hypothetical protein
VDDFTISTNSSPVRRDDPHGCWHIILGLKVAFPLTALHFRLLTSLDHSANYPFLVAGGVSLVGGPGAPMKETASLAGAHDGTNTG